MKSSEEQLIKRGKIENNDIEKYIHSTKESLIEGLKSKEACERSIAARILGEKHINHEEIIHMLCEILKKEKKLYTKNEICNALSMADENSVSIMSNYLGAIGNNQHKELPDKKFNKSSYPLPRDIIARTMVRMNIKILPELLDILEGNDINKIREVIDTIGFLSFYNKVESPEYILQKLICCLNTYKDDNIIRWKVIRALESFDYEISIDILEQFVDDEEEEMIKIEAIRSLEIIQKRR